MPISFRKDRSSWLSNKPDPSTSYLQRQQQQQTTAAADSRQQQQQTTAAAANNDNNHRNFNEHTCNTNQ